jgi:hypothetical protein
MTDRRRNWIYAFNLITKINRKIPPNAPEKRDIAYLRSVLHDIKREEEI